VPKNWFSKIGHFMLYLDDGINVYKQFLENVMQMPEENFIPFVKNFYSNPQALEETYSFGSVTFAMIACQEMSMAKENLSMNYIFSPENQLISDFFNEDDEQNCKTINIKHDQDRIYKANQFKVDVPVYYLLGENDGATSLVQGLKHAKNVALNRKQVFILEKGGHLPLLGHLKEYREDNNDTIKSESVEWFKKMINSQIISNSDLSLLNSNSPLQWQIN
jgi:pimeloyl-ACP methyl ester carboxylesterase